MLKFGVVWLFLYWVYSSWSTYIQNLRLPSEKLNCTLSKTQHFLLLQLNFCWQKFINESDFPILPLKNNMGLSIHLISSPVLSTTKCLSPSLSTSTLSPQTTRETETTEWFLVSALIYGKYFLKRIYHYGTSW